jgi:hypothetical protein
VTEALTALAALAVASTVSAALVRRSPERLVVLSWDGRRVPAVLGIGFLAGLLAAAAVPFLTEATLTLSEIGVIGGISALVMGLAGSVDDLRGGEARGFRAHLSSLIRLRVTTGGLKLLVGATLAILLAASAGGPPERVVGMALLIAISTNLANALDVRPGRALKYALPVLAVVWLVSADQSVTWLSAAATGAAVGILPLDLAQRGMLGDSGSNPLGLASGLGLAVTLPTWGVLLAAGVAVVLQVVAETVTISRVIEAVPPLRWYDGLGGRR